MGTYNIESTTRIPLNWYEALVKEAEKEGRPAGQMNRVIITKYEGYSITEDIPVVVGLRKMPFKKVQLYASKHLFTKIKRKQKSSMRCRNDVLVYILYLYLNERYDIEQLYK